MNTTDLLNIVALQLVSHLIADFFFQTRQMGEGKSKSLYWLTMHILTYTAVLTICSCWYLIPVLGLLHFIGYIIMNGMFHFVTDFITSKGTTYFYEKAEKIKADLVYTDDEKLVKTRKCMKGFWSVIGIDQAIHGITLVQTLKFYL